MTWKFALPLLPQADFFLKYEAVLMMSLETLNYPYYHKVNAPDNKTIPKPSLENLTCPYYHELKVLQKWNSFVDVIWKFELPLLSQAQMFAKIKQFCWSDLKIWHAPITASWNSCKDKAVLMMSLKILNCPYYHEVNFPQKWSSFVDVIWNFEQPLLSRAGIFSKIW